MKYIIVYFFFQFIYPSIDTLVLINNKVITKNDFLRRAEYTIRPTYCNSDNNVDKKIILNSLIAEKLYAIENSDFEIKDRHHMNSINGIKEQAMRQVMLEEHVNSNISINDDKLKKLYLNSRFKYDIKFITINHAQIGEISSLDSFSDISKKLNISPNTKQISFFDCNNNEVFNYFYYGNNIIQRGDLIGPLVLKDNKAILIKVLNKKTNVNLNQLAELEAYKKIEDFYVEFESSKIRNEFVANLMSGKQIEFRDDAFKNLANYYYNDELATQVDFEQVLFNIDQKDWKIRELIDINNTRPLVFRDSYSNKKDFFIQFKLALVDLVRDFYLTNKAYAYGFDNHAAVLNEVEIWTDYMLAHDMKNQLVANKSEIEEIKNEYDLIKNILTPKSNLLFKKYSDQIVVDVDMFNDIKLSSIDMVVINVNQPYQLLVPLFPKLTTKNDLNYGIKKPT